MLASGDATVIFLNYDQLGKIRIPDSGGIVSKTYIFNNSNLLSCKNWNQFPTQLSSHIVALSKGTIFTSLPRNANFLQKNAGISKIKRAGTYVPNFKFLV